MPDTVNTAQDIKTTWEKILGYFTPSTIRGVIVVFGTLGWNFTEGKLQAWLAVISLLVFGLFDIFRTDSAQKAVGLVEAALKKRGVIALLIMIGAALMLPINAHAASAYCVEPQITAGTYTIQVDGGDLITELPFVAQSDPDGDWHCIYDVGSLGAGDHVFRSMAVDASGWEGVWSVPFDARRPGASTRAKIRQE